MPWFWSLLALQLVNGAAVSFAWSGAQTLIAQLAKGEAHYLGRFTFFARLGSTTAPMLGGAAWDFGGTWLSYLIGVVWGGVLIVALLYAPEAELFGLHTKRVRCVPGSAPAMFGPGFRITGLR